MVMYLMPLKFNLIYPSELSLKFGFVLDINNSNFGNLIGFDEKLYGFTNKLENSTHYGTKTPNITNSIDTIDTIFIVI